MAWIESHQSVARHPKTIRLARSLDVSKSSAIGYLHLLWWWALDYAQDGDLSKYTVDEIEAGAEWEGERGKFKDALHQAGYVDEDDQLHDWYDYAGKLIEQRERDAERKREARSKKKKDIPKMSGVRPQDIRQTSEVRPHVPTNQPNQPTEPTQPVSMTHATSELVKAYEQVFGPLNGPADDWLDLLHYMDKGMDLELIVEAIFKSKHADKPLNYADSILKNQLRKGIRSIASALEADDERKKRLEPQIGPHTPNGLPSYVLDKMKQEEEETDAHRPKPS